jgi:hypothetical protein
LCQRRDEFNTQLLKESDDILELLTVWTLEDHGSTE